MGKILRRTFLIGTAAIAGGVAFGTYVVKKPYDNPLEGKVAEGETTFNPYLIITRDNQITALIPRSEMGQGVTTTLAALLAEELDVNIEDIKVEHAPAANAYYNAAAMEDGSPFAHYERGFIAETTRDALGSLGKVLGLQVTGGSSSVKDAWLKMREAGAAARETLKLAAAKREGVAVQTLKSEAGHIIAGDKKIPYGELAQAAAKLDPPRELVLRDSKDWKMLGRPLPRTDAKAKSTGAPIFGIDVRLPDMLFATIKMNPNLGAAMKSFNADATKTVKGVVKVVEMKRQDKEKFGGGVAVIATNTWAAFKGAEALEIEWENASYPKNDADIARILDEALSRQDQTPRDDGDMTVVFADANPDRIVNAQYEVPYLAHATMEPMNATAWLRDGKFDIWTGTQFPTLARDDCAFEVGLEPEAVEVHTAYLGGGFGRRGEIDFTRFAARVAKETDGKPVQVVWTREEDMTHDTYRPASKARMRALLGEDGLPLALDVQLASPSIIASVMGRTFPSLSPMGPDSTMFHGAADQPYGIENYRVAAGIASIDIPIGFWRSVGHSYNAYYMESFLDEVAQEAGKDPLEMRLALLKDHPAAIGVLEKVAEMSNWKVPAQLGRGKGLAFHLSFGSWTAEVVEVSMQDDEVKIENVWCAVDVGTALDPSIIKAQMQSGIVFGLSAALGQEITFADGQVEQMNFDTYDVMRMHQCPNISVEVLENAAYLGGAGEPGTPPAIPALANAIHAATGKRLRQMPLSREVDFL